MIRTLRTRAADSRWQWHYFCEGFCERCLHVGLIRCHSPGDIAPSRVGLCNRCTEGSERPGDPDKTVSPTHGPKLRTFWLALHGIGSWLGVLETHRPH